MRRSQLKSDPAKARAWQERSRRKPKRSRSGSSGWKGRVFSLRGTGCAVCGQRAVQAHHVVPRHKIVTAQRGEFAYDERNGLPICLRCHERHETATARIPRSCLPADAIAWAVEHGFDWYVDDNRIYP